MTNSPQAATAAAPADAPADEESLYQATIQTLDAPEKETSMLRKAALLVGTLALSVLAFLWLGFPLLFLLILIGVLLFHELGHYLGMQLFGYRDVRMFFIPFFGAAVSGRKYAAPVWQEATMLLLGPLPGLALAVALIWLYEPALGTELYVLVLILAYVNAFNLLPVAPLDGGRLVNLLFFARQPFLAAGFQLLAGCALVALAWFLPSWVLGFLGGMMLLGVSYTYSEARHGEQLRAENLELPDEIERLSETQRRHLFARAVRRVPQDQHSPARLAGEVRAVYEHMMARRPSVLVTVLFMALYLSGFAAYTAVSYWEHPLAVAQTTDRRGLRASIDRKDAEALAEYQKALAIRQAYVAKHPTRVEALHALSLSYANLAVRAPAAQRLEDLEKVVAIREKLVEREPSAVKWQYGLSQAYDALASYYSGSMPEKALVHQRKAIALQERAIAKDWRGRLGEWWSYERDRKNENWHLAQLHSGAGGLLMALAQPREAVIHYRASLAIYEKTAASQVLVAYGRQSLGMALVAAGDRVEAIEHLRKATGIYHQEFATSDTPSFVLGSWDGAVHALAPLLLDMGRESDALEAYRSALAASEKYASDRERKETSEKGGKPGQDTAWVLQRVSKAALYARDFAKALAAAERSLSLAPGYRQVEAYRAHALLLVGRADEAKAAYLARKGQPAVAGKTWEQLVSEGFASLKRARLTHPMMAEIEKLLGLSEQQ
jgi:tetratricopeptide (TPR) repeat protein/Zn-dependent protease